MGHLTGTRGRLVLLAVAVFALALLIADGALLESEAVTQSQESDAVLVAQAHVIASNLQDSNGQVSLGGADLPGETESGIAVDAAVVSANAVVAKTTNQPLANGVLLSLAARAIRSGGPVWADVVDARSVPRRAYAVPLSTGSTPGEAIVVSRSVGEMLAAQRRTFLILFIVSAALLVIGGALSYWLAGRALRPVRTIAGLARSISEHDLHRRVDVKVPSDELGELVDTFNTMLARLEAGFISMGKFTADASHELRAPLALMRVQLEGALSRGRSRDEYKQVLESMQVEVEHLSRLADQLLILARADAGALLPAKEPVDVADFLHETAIRWEGIAAEHRTRLEVSAPSSGRMEADPALLRRVLDNLIENAFRHTPEGTAVLLRGYAADGGWNVEVADHGPGVPPEHRVRLFSRFARTDSARSPDAGGAGLGLALSAAIARAHGGTLELVANGPAGANFRLHMPDQPTSKT
ncbi:MAG: ATP-binding protein [Candidatus Dormibacteraceae bacterium]